MAEYDKNKTEMPGEFVAAVSSGRPELLRSLRNNVLEGVAVLDVQQQARLIDYVADSIVKRGNSSSDAVRLQDKLHDIQRGLDGLGTMALRALEIAEELE